MGEKEGREVRFHRFGNPAEVLELERPECAKPAEGEALVKVLASPVNPADLNFIEGTYGVRPELPAVPGMEGCGEVLACPGGALAPGSRVLILRKSGAWCTERILPVSELLELPAGIDPLQAAMLAVNPLTALRLLEDFVALRRGDWIVQNAANSNVGRCVIQLARSRGINTINVVRKTALRAELEELGADVVLADGEALGREALAATGGSRPVLALNAVGGESALRQLDLLERRGTQVTYGAMSRQSLKVPNKFLIFRELVLTGFWVTKWLESAASGQAPEAFRFLARLVMEGRLRQAIDSTYPLSAAREACQRAAAEGRSGKVLLVPDPD